MELIDIALIIALVISVVLHEMAHGYAASYLGDPTARLAGRLTPNPIVHLDPLMSVIIPGLLVLSGSPFIFGAAKPVPYNPYNFSNQKWGEAFVAVAGPLTNVAIAIVFALLVRFSDLLGLNDMFTTLAFQVIILNLFLAFLNMLPVPPLDGSKILPRLLPRKLSMQYDNLRRAMEQNILLSLGIVLFLFAFVLGTPLFYATRAIALFMVGA